MKYGTQADLGRHKQAHRRDLRDHDSSRKLNPALCQRWSRSGGSHSLPPLWGRLQSPVCIPTRFSVELPLKIKWATKYGKDDTFIIRLDCRIDIRRKFQSYKARFHMFLSFRNESLSRLDAVRTHVLKLFCRSFFMLRWTVLVIQKYDLSNILNSAKGKSRVRKTRTKNVRM